MDEPFAGTKFQASRPKLLKAMMRCFARSAGFFYGRVFCKILSRPHNDAPDIFAKTGSHKGGIGQMLDPKNDIDPLVYEVNEPINEEKIG
jgi:hypothetical protein